MKIECPVCGLVLDNFDNPRFLGTHLKIHKYQSVDEYAKLLFKIHEKIERLETQIEYYRGILIKNNLIQNDEEFEFERLTKPIIQELKSLLEESK